MRSSEDAGAARRALGALAAVVLGGCAAGDEVWVLTFSERHISPCSDTLSGDAGGYTQDAQANVMLAVHEGPGGTITVDWAPTLTGARTGAEFEATWTTEREETLSTGESHVLSEEIVLSGEIVGRDLSGTLEETRTTTTIADVDGDGVPDTTQTSCGQDNDFTGWVL